MIAFIVPIKPKSSASSWSRFSAIVERTLHSICSQTSDNFQVIAVVSDSLESDFTHPNLRYVSFDSTKYEHLSHLTYSWPSETDKARRILQGLEVAKSLNVSHTMVVDADDCVSPLIAEFVSQNTSEMGWFIRSGFMSHDKRALLFYKKTNFNNVCGTCMILKTSMLDKFIRNKGNDLYFQHSWVESEEISLKPLPFAGAIYSVGNGENYFMTTVRQRSLAVKRGIVSPKVILDRLKKYRLVLFPNRVRKEFGYYFIS